jgi:hypothetical protein
VITNVFESFCTSPHLELLPQSVEKDDYADGDRIENYIFDKHPFLRYMLGFTMVFAVVSVH